VASEVRGGVDGEPVSRRGFLRFLPILSAAPSIVGKIAVREVWVTTSQRLANGAVLKTTKVYRFLLNGTRQLWGDVDWVVRRGETIDGSTVYRIWNGVKERVKG
jgi:hypothetical protein